MESARHPYRCGRLAGFRYGQVPREIEAALERWVRTGRIEEGEELKPGRVWRVGPWAVKLWREAALASLRRSRALHSAELAIAIHPLRTPRPLLAVEERRAGFLRASLWVGEYVGGRWLHRLWDEDPAARTAFAAFLAGMHGRGVLHGDLNVRNALWNGAEWVLIDLDGLRSARGRPPARKVVEEQWARILAAVRLREGSRELFDEYLKHARSPPSERAARGREPAWNRVRARAEALARVYDEVLRAREAQLAVLGSRDVVEE